MANMIPFFCHPPANFESSSATEAAASRRSSTDKESDMRNLIVCVTASMTFAAATAHAGAEESLSAAASEEHTPTMLMGAVGLPDLVTATIPPDDLDVFAGKRSVVKAVKNAAKAATMSTPSLAKATKAASTAANTVKAVPAYMAIDATVRYGAPIAWAAGSKLGEALYGQPAGPYPGFKAAVVGK